jgi:hypothetical protein
MTEREWLIEKSGLTADQVTALEAVAGADKFTAILKSAIAENEAGMKAKADAEATRLAFEKRYAEEYQPQMTQLAKDNLKATQEAAAAKAALEKVREWGFLEKETTPPETPPRAPGSPDPNSISRDDFGRFSQAQSNTIMALQDLNAEHFKLFGQPLGNTQELAAEAQRQRTLGNKDFSLRQAWEAKYNVAAKRDEIAKAERQKEIDAAIAADRKARAEASGGNPNLTSGKPSRFSTYKPQDSNSQPWKSSPIAHERNAGWRNKALEEFRKASAA